jgi:hypothetical protein
MTRVSPNDIGTHWSGRCYGDMPLDLTEALRCKFCRGQLRFDFERKTKAAGFSYFRCDACGLSNVFSVQSQPAAMWPQSRT